MGEVGWQGVEQFHLAQDRGQWWDPVKIVMKGGEFTQWLSTVRFSSGTVPLGVNALIFE
jgi:hypothetical protein